MCKYLIAKKKPEAQEGELELSIVGSAETSNDAFDKAEALVLSHGVDAYVFERISVGRASACVKWEGKARPGVR